ncbi:MAG: LamG-like jellyroll fold domain-containing protein [Sedimentisphaerales bacterium]
MEKFNKKNLVMLFLLFLVWCKVPAFGDLDPNAWVYPVPATELISDANTIALLHFNENASYPSTVTSQDSSGNGNNAVVFIDPEYLYNSTGYNNTWIKFGASAALQTNWSNYSYFVMPDNATLDFDYVSIECFFLCNNSINTNDLMTIVTRNTGSQSGGFSIYMDPMGDGVAANQYATIWAEIAGVDLNRIPDGYDPGDPCSPQPTGKRTVVQNDLEYHHVALTFDGAYARLYLDGVLEDKGISAFGSLPPSAADIRIGGGGAQVGWAGRIDEVRISNFDRGAQEGTCKGEWVRGNGIVSDLNQDCYIDFRDFAAMAADWLKCNDPQNGICDN